MTSSITDLSYTIGVAAQLPAFIDNVPKFNAASPNTWISDGGQGGSKK